ncbi:MAG: class I SAM-dependent methyltransferase [Candidatus Marinimicrobia bacterium]|nr:class I SAM-dependent methyltransferase [Candidatus Neomarinimicrobiota bacterium]
MKNEMEIWERKRGAEFLKQIGIKKGDVVIDFGAGYGHYTLPGAKVVGEAGIIYAVDKDKKPLSAINKKASKYGITNIITIENSDGVTLTFESESIDAVLLFDILHYLEKNKRRKLYQEIHRVLRSNKLLSLYPRHIKDDHPAGEFKDLRLEDVKYEIQMESFTFDEKFCGTISHDEKLVPGCVFNFRKDDLDTALREVKRV